MIVLNYNLGLQKRFIQIIFIIKNPIAKKFINKYSLDEKQIKKLSDYCKKIKIGFSSTPYSKEEVDFLVNVCESSFVKIASMDINNYNFIEYIAKKKVPVVISLVWQV